MQPLRPGPRLIGRDRELVALREAFSRGSRIVTLLGPGGMGKTSIARVVAPEPFVDLSGLQSLDDVCTATCRALGMEVADARMQLESIGPVRITLDNAEDAIAATTTMVAALLDRTPATFVVTSRVALRLPDEVIIELMPLSKDGALELWTDRVRRVRPGYAIDDDERAVALNILSKLDGIPLAIEIAATRMRVLQSHELLHKMNDRFALLRADSRIWDERHRALGSVIETSWEALSAHEKDALAQLTVFSGTFTALAAEAVVQLPKGAPSVLDVLQSLRDRSLLMAPEERPDRLALYDTVRAFAETKREASEADARHAGHYASVARGLLATDVRTRKDRDALEAAIDLDRQNFKVAAERKAAAQADAILCLAVLDVIHPSLEASSREVGLVDALTANTKTLEGDAAIWAGMLRGQLFRRTGKYDEAEAMFLRAVELARSQEAPDALAMHARIAWATMHVLRGSTDVEEELTNIAEGGVTIARGRALLQLGVVCSSKGKDEEARTFYARAIAPLEAASQAELAQAYLFLGEAEMDLDVLDRAREAIEKADAIRARLGDRRLHAMVLNMQGWLAIHEGDYPRAATIYAFAKEIAASTASASALIGHLSGWEGMARFMAREYELAIEQLDLGVTLARAVENRELFLTLLCTARALTGSLSVDEAIAKMPAPRIARAAHERELAMCLAMLERGTPEQQRTAATRGAELAARRHTGSAIEFLTRRLQESLTAHDKSARRLRIDRNGGWFVRADARVDLGGQHLLKRILVGLVEAHGEKKVLSIETLFALGWPGEKASATSVEDRVRAVVKRLRRLGLDGVLEARAGGFCFGEDVVLELGGTS